MDELLVQLYRPDLESFVVELERPELAESLARIPVAVSIMAGQRTRPVPIALVSAQAEAARAKGLGVLGRLFATPAPAL